MKLLTEVADINELTRLRILFDSKGIAIHVANEDSARNLGFILPVRKYALFVVFDDQMQDALALLDDETHEVKKTVDLNEYYSYISKHQPEATNKIFNTLMSIFLVVVIALIAFIFIMNTVHKS